MYIASTEDLTEVMQCCVLKFVFSLYHRVDLEDIAHDIAFSFSSARNIILKSVSDVFNETMSYNDIHHKPLETIMVKKQLQKRNLSPVGMNL